MKKFLAIALCSAPLALAPTVYAQSSTAGGAATGAPASTGASASPDAATKPATGSGSAAMGSSATTSSAAAGAEAGMQASADDWSVKHGIMGKAVHNENGDKVGDITDVIVSQDGKITAFVVGAGGFLGMGEHNVAIPFDKITKSGDDDKLMLAGYTKEQLKELPKYEAPKSERPMTTGTSGSPATSGTPANPVTPAPGAATGTTTAPPASTTR